MKAKHCITLRWTQDDFEPDQCQPKDFDWARMIEAGTSQSIEDGTVVVEAPMVLVTRPLFDIVREAHVLLYQGAMVDIVLKGDMLFIDLPTYATTFNVYQEVAIRADGDVLAIDVLGVTHALFFYRKFAS